MTSYIEKIAQLRRVTPENGATEGEALNAFNLANNLMEKHGITEEDLNKVEFSRDMDEKRFHYHQKQQHPSVRYCANSIARFCEIVCWGDKAKKAGCFFGMKGDTEMAIFLTKLIHDAMERGWKEYLANGVSTETSRHSQYWGFMIGFAERMNQRLNELYLARKQSVTSTGTDLIVKKNALIKEGLKALRPDLDLVGGKGRGRHIDSQAKVDGKSAANKVNLNRPLRGKNGTRMIA
jgi:hypothetical protein